MFEDIRVSKEGKSIEGKEINVLRNELVGISLIWLLGMLVVGEKVAMHKAGFERKCWFYLMRTHAGIVFIIKKM